VRGREHRRTVRGEPALIGNERPVVRAAKGQRSTAVQLEADGLQCERIPSLNAPGAQCQHHVNVVADGNEVGRADRVSDLAVGVARIRCGRGHDRRRKGDAEDQA
jgi:hypothetical protein